MNPWEFPDQTQRVISLTGLVKALWQGVKWIRETTKRNRGASRIGVDSQKGGSNVRQELER